MKSSESFSMCFRIYEKITPESFKSNILKKKDITAFSKKSLETINKERFGCKIHKKAVFSCVAQKESDLLSDLKYCATLKVIDAKNSSETFLLQVQNGAHGQSRLILLKSILMTIMRT